MGFIAELFGAKNNAEGHLTAIDQVNYNDPLRKLLAGSATNQVDFGGANSTAVKQNQLADALLSQAQGQGPSVAQNQLNQSTGQNIASSGSLLASQKGINPALAARLILNNQANQQQQMAGQAATMRAQEQLGAQGTLGNALGTQRSQDINQSLGTVNANNSQLSTLGGLGQNQSQLNLANQQGVDNLNAKVEAGNAQQAGGILGSIAGAAGSILTGGLLGGGDKKKASQGWKVPGVAEVAGDSEQNDTVPALLSPGEIVVPRTAAKDPEKAKEFIEVLTKRNKMKKGEEPSFGQVLEAQRHLHGRLSKLEAMWCGGMVK